MKISTLSSYCALLLASAAAYTEPVYDEELGCWPVSVEHDATYCITGPICSGSGPSPTGSLCPVKGDSAIEDCHSYLASYTGGESCVLPMDATCQVIKTGAWGCVISGYPTPAPTKYEYPTPAPTKYEHPTPAPTKYEHLTPAPTKYEHPTPAPTKYGDQGGSNGEAASSGGISVGVIGAVAAAAAAVAAVAGVAIYRQHVKRVHQEKESVMVEVVTP
ncbi:hypothetical protein PF005_g16398 [Phytophthora fragariae]|uniref:Uncharacterized protein n=1 Tax=Phytophthora fragariae TaxID=53985 RepID=A0A6A3JK65_9STRA|nr:hypothetical protein PF009_g17476 [Phytophthora fragariae]KAE8995536.1 hypothetical protein PF011_g16288 [Phytophthora fragariae]KAE9092330.1 hypothetical protein PF006_g24728 [Phytophthora fragariae]KAE9098027.1 hypothetical protein PF007_g16411 [Phytophthora fragariae]KAE9197738.1 hypothetical protein PF005_g16398 [Phytophthora fragariae]